MIEDYGTYSFTVKEKIRYFLEGLLMAVILGFLFYKSIAGVIVLSPLIIWHFKLKKSELVQKRKWKLNLEFKDGINSLAAALSAGFSVEHAFEEAVKDLKRMYPNGAMIIREFTYIANQIQMNITAEKALYNFGRRSGVDDIICFAEVFSTAKRTGGDLVQIIRTTANMIGDKLEVKREIMTMLAGKKLEANIMKYVPAGILCFLSVSSPDILKPLYHNLFGITIMSILLGVYIYTSRLMDKIMNIEV
ncbi:MAG TPA: type II secretion system F family protein [Mobilitalea sp.]|nr:type II secretion system F family protein [Mobilitalea sp.]